MMADVSRPASAVPGPPQLRTPCDCAAIILAGIFFVTSPNFNSTSTRHTKIKYEKFHTIHATLRQ